MKSRTFVGFTLAFLWAVVSAHAEINVVKTGDTVVDPTALTTKDAHRQGINGLSFQQDAVVTHAGYQYVGYYDAGRRVCIARRPLPDGAWSVIRFTDYHFASNDSHNVICIGVCPNDGTIHMAFDHHGHPLHYRVSRRGVATAPGTTPWEASLFGPIRSELEAGKPIRITYPRFWQTPGGDLQFCYRQGGSGNGDRMLVDYDSESGIWANTRQIDSRGGVFEDSKGASRSRCSYPNGYTYGPTGKLHTTWVWRESSQGANHDLMYTVSEDLGVTWRNNRGEIFDEPPHVNSPGLTVVDISRLHGLMNTHGQAVDSKDRIHVVMWHCTNESLKAVGSKPGEHRWGLPEARRYHHYWRDVDGKWHHYELPWIAGDRPKVFVDERDNAYLIYAVRNEVEGRVGNVSYREHDLVIAGASAESNWTDWTILHAEPGPFQREMLGDLYRWQQEGVLSIMAQQRSDQPRDPTPLRILDFNFH
jgi:hypothetical protein